MQQQDVGHVGHVAMSWQIKEAIDAGPIGSQIYKLFCYRSVFISFNRQFEKFAFQTINKCFYILAGGIFNLPRSLQRTFVSRVLRVGKKLVYKRYICIYIYHGNSRNSSNNIFDN